MTTFAQAMTVRPMKVTDLTTGEKTFARDTKNPKWIRVVAFMGGLSLTCSMAETELTAQTMWNDVKGNEVFSAVVCAPVEAEVTQSINPNTGKPQYKSELGKITLIPLTRGADGKLHVVEIPD